MQDLVGIVRNQAGMAEGLEKVLSLRERAGKAHSPGNREYNPGWHTALDLSSLLLVSEAVARSALLRKESRGAHFREDYEQKEDAFATLNTVLKRAEDGSMEVRQEPTPPLTAEHEQIIEENQ